MTDYLRLALIFLLAVNPAAAFIAMIPVRSRTPQTAWLPASAAGLALAGALYAGAVVGADALLDLLEIEPETFRVAAGVVLAAMGARALLPTRNEFDDALAGWRFGVYPLGIPLLAGPAGLMAALSYGADEGAGFTFVAAAPALVVAAALAARAPERWRPAFAMVAPLAAALLVAAGAGLIVTGVRDI